MYGKPLISRQLSSLVISMFLVFGSTLLPSIVHAEYFGLMNGRLPPTTQTAKLSVEVGYVSGEYSEIDYNNPAARINYQLQDNIQVFGTLGKTTIGSEGEMTFGAGGFVNLGNLLPFSESVAFKGSVHIVNMRSAGRPGSVGSIGLENCGQLTLQYNYSFLDPGYDLEPGGCDVTTTSGTSGTSGSSSTVTALSLEMLLGGEPIDKLALASGKIPAWYANIGLHSFNGSSKDATIGFGAGLVLPLKAGDAYVGLDKIGDLILGFGFRYKIQ